MSETRIPPAAAAQAANVPEGTGFTAAGPARLRTTAGRRQLRRRVRPGAPWWRRCLDFAVATAVVVGGLWFLVAPGGALQGDRSDFNSWFARDAVLGMLLCAAGIATAVHGMLVRQGADRAAPQWQENSWAFAAVLTLAAMLGAVLAWRTGVFAGDLFQSPPANMANPSMVFSLRSGAALLLWPLSSMLVVFIWSALSPQATAESAPQATAEAAPGAGA